MKKEWYLIIIRDEDKKVVAELHGPTGEVLGEAKGPTDTHARLTVLQQYVDKERQAQNNAASITPEGIDASVRAGQIGGE